MLPRKPSPYGGNFEWQIWEEVEIILENEPLQKGSVCTDRNVRTFLTTTAWVLEQEVQKLTHSRTHFVR